MGRLLSIQIILLLLTANATAFDPPTCGDPWYYQTDDRGLTFMVPDKAQHYYGSYLLTEITSKYNISPVIVFTLGFLWEVKDNKTSLNTTNGVVGFSYRDLIADGLGILSSRVNKHKNARLYLNYSTLEKTIELKGSWVFY